MIREPAVSALIALDRYLQGLRPGRIHGRYRLLEALEATWPALSGGAALGMQANKLYRIEDVHWNPPLLTFDIERHPYTTRSLFYGQGRVEHWVVDVLQGTARVAHARRRLLSGSGSGTRWAGVLGTVSERGA